MPVRHTCTVKPVRVYPPSMLCYQNIWSSITGYKSDWAPSSPHVLSRTHKSLSYLLSYFFRKLVVLCKKCIEHKWCIFSRATTFIWNIFCATNIYQNNVKKAIIFDFFWILTLKMTLSVIFTIIFVISASKYSSIPTDIKIRCFRFSELYPWYWCHFVL